MARIRTIKPEFWDDEKVGKLTFGARLLFIGTWNLADDEGYLKWNANFLKSKIFLYDDPKTVPINRYMKELTNAGFIVPDPGFPPRTSAELPNIPPNEHTDVVAKIKSFGKHQHINRPKPSYCPQDVKDRIALIIVNNSLIQHGTNNEPSLLEREGNGREQGTGKGREGKAATGKPELFDASKKDEIYTLKKDGESFVDQVEPGSDNTEQNLAAISTCYEQNIGLLTPMIAEELKDLSLEFSFEWFAEAVKEACNAQARNLRYVTKILERWKAEGFKAHWGNKPQAKSSQPVEGITIEE